MTDSVTAGFKYIAREGVTKVKIKVRGYCQSVFEVKTSWEGPPLGHIPVGFANVWKEYAIDVAVPDGVQALYFTYTGNGCASLASFTLE